MSSDIEEKNCWHNENVLGYVCNPSSSKERDAASKDA